MEVRRADEEAAVEAALSVRRSVFVDEQGVPAHRELDGRDDAATHFLACDGGRAVGAARLRESDPMRAKVERVAVLPSERGRGLGRKLMAAVETHAADEGYVAVFLHAQVPVVAFYEGLGYKVTTETFEEAGIPHREMRKPL